MLVAASFATGALAQIPCEDPRLDPATGQTTTLAIEILEPLPGEERRVFGTDCPVTVRGIASAIGLPASFDFYLVIDASSSTAESSGADVNGDGVVETERDTPDSILEAELRAAASFVAAVDLERNRVAIVHFSNVAHLDAPLTTDRALLAAAVEALHGTSDRGTNYGAPLEAVLAEHDAHHDPDHHQIVLFLSDGFPNITHPAPASPAPCAWPQPACDAIDWTILLHATGLTIDTFAIGSFTGADVLADMADVGGGRTWVLDVAGTIVDLLPSICHVGIAEIRIDEEATGTHAVLAPAPDGAFSLELPSFEGARTIVATAVALDDPSWTIPCETSYTSTCIEVGCPDEILLECDRDASADTGPWLAWADDALVDITHASAAGTGGADAGGRYPLGETDVTWTFSDDQAGTESCGSRVVIVDTTPPELVGVPGDLVLGCDRPIPSDVPAVEDCDPAARLEEAQEIVDGPCPDDYTVIRTWTATDAAGHSTTARQVVEFRDDEPPVLVGVPDDLVLPCPEEPPPADVRALDTCDPDPPVQADEQRLPGRCAGEWTIVRTWSAVDRCGNAVEATQRIEIVDRTPPVITASPDDRFCAWPPRHGVVTIPAETFHPTVEDSCTDVVSWLLADCTSSQPDDDRGDGHTEGDCTVAPDGRALVVRIERQGVTEERHSGRTYVVRAIAVDACGNASEPAVIGEIRVPHDRSPHDATCDGLPFVFGG